MKAKRSGPATIWMLFWDDGAHWFTTRSDAVKYRAINDIDGDVVGPYKRSAKRRESPDQ